MASAISVGGNSRVWGGVPSLNCFSENPEKLKRFVRLFENLKQLTEFKEGEKPIFNKKTKVLSVDLSGGSISRYCKKAFHPNYIVNLCENARKALLNTAPVIEKIKATDGETKWLAIQRGFNALRPFHDGNLLNTKLVVLLNGLSSDKYTKKDIWTLLKGAMLAQLVVPLIEEEPNALPHYRAKPLEIGFRALLSTYKKGWIYDKLFQQSVIWPFTLEEASTTILIPQLDASRVSLRTPAKRSTSRRLPRAKKKPERRPGRRSRLQQEILVSSPETSSSVAVPAKLEQSMPTPPPALLAPKLPLMVGKESSSKKKKETSQSNIPHARPKMPRIQKESLFEYLKARTLSGNEIDAQVTRRREERAREIDLESKEKFSRGFNINGLLKASLRDEASQDESEYSSFDDEDESYTEKSNYVSGEKKKSLEAVGLSETVAEEDDDFVHISAPVKNTIVRSVSEIFSSNSVQTKIVRWNSMNFNSEIHLAVMKKFKNSNPSDTDSDCDKWSDAETKSGFLGSLIGSFFG